VRITLLFNPVAGSGRAHDAAERLGASLQGAGHRVDLQQTEPIPGPDWMVSAMESTELLVVLGGDGAVRLASGPAIRDDRPLYVFPLGTENLFARQFGMKRSARQLLDAIDRFEVQRVDVGIVGVERFLLMASVGFDASVVVDLASRRTGGISRLSYLPPILRKLRSWRAPALTVSVDDRVVVEGRRGFVIVANSRHYAVRLDPARRASMTDGLLDVVFFPCSGSFGAMRWLVACRLGLHVGRRGFVYRTGARVRVRSEPEHPYQLDGDPAEGESTISELTATLRPGALSVLVP
jgi:diacylglycerol kinase family enzyme